MSYYVATNLSDQHFIVSVIIIKIVRKQLVSLEIVLSNSFSAALNL